MYLTYIMFLVQKELLLEFSFLSRGEQIAFPLRQERKYNSRAMCCTFSETI